MPAAFPWWSLLLLLLLLQTCFNAAAAELASLTLGATSTTLMSLRKSTPSFFITPSRKPWLRPSVAPGFMAARMRGYSLAWTQAAAAAAGYDGVAR
jgi:hypothetical protein